MPDSELTAAFDAAVTRSKNLEERPNNPTLLKIYALYKQATEGDVSEPRPAFSDVVARAKWDAWNGLKGVVPDTARHEYIDLIDSLE